MASIKTSQPVPYMNGIKDRLPPSKETIARRQVELINGHDDEENLSDSDIDGLSTTRSVLLPNQRVPVKSPEPPTNSDDSLMQWLMQQFQQNGIQQIQQSPMVQPKSNFRNVEDVTTHNNELFSGSQVQLSDPVVKGNGMVKRDRWAKSCTRLDRVKPGTELHYPRMPRSRDASLRRRAKDPIDSVNQLLDEINRKAEGLKCDNDRIKQELEKATTIIGDLKQSRQQKAYRSDRWAVSTTALQSPSRYDIARNKQNPVLRLKRLNNTKMNSSQCLLTRSAYPDPIGDTTDRSVTQLNEPRTPTVHRLRSDHRFVMDDRLPQSPPPSWNDSSLPKEEVRLRETRETPTHIRYPMTRRYSTTQQVEPIEPREEYRESSLGPLTSDYHRGSNGTSITSSNGVASKFSWIGRALSQLSLADWTGKPKPDSKSDQRRADGATPEIYGRLSPPVNGAKNLSTMIRRPFRRKATTPSPRPAVISSAVPYEENTSGNRCLSLMHLNGSSLSSFEEPEADRDRTDEPLQFRSDRKNNASFVHPT
ncbi:unnamed protein product [Echinostoma caproni]|uniref:Uncharacterized protein n=1 Tax=Echinostoma caproni TaxID=27848 RepID=A0A183A504_9TREM|nr:unnamed protein product [Echinostoma caproni]